jgi:hypothetical protein
MGARVSSRPRDEAGWTTSAAIHENKMEKAGVWVEISGFYPRPVNRLMRQGSTNVEVDSANEAKPQTGQSGTVDSAVGGVLGPTANQKSGRRPEI